MGVMTVLVVLILANAAFAGVGDLNFDGIFEVALDLPRILFLLKRDANEPALEYQGNFELNWAFLDTGASGILLSRETIDWMEISLEPGAQYADVGIGGIELFDVAEPLYFGTDYLNDIDPNNQNHYLLSGPWHFQVKQTYAGDWPDEPLDLLGMPVMAGKVVVLDSGATNDLEYFAADIKAVGDPNIPTVDFNVPIRFEKYYNRYDTNNIPPLPVLAYNPVIDNVTTEYGATSISGTWLLDTGGTISLMSTATAAAMGLVDGDGSSIVTPDFVIPIGGVGTEDVNIPGYEVDNLIIPTLNGYNLVYNHARIGVHDIGIIDEDTGEPLILDGVFGSNFLCASAKMVGGWPVELAETPYNKIVIDMQKGLLGFDVFDTYPLPTSYMSVCSDAANPWPQADFNHDCSVDFKDLKILSEEWLEQCDWLNWNCSDTDSDRDGTVELQDFARFAQ